MCMQNNVISIRITGPYGSQPSSVVFASKTATFGSQWHVSMGRRLRLLICECISACKTATSGSELQVSMGPRLHLLICECKTACLEPEWCLSLAPSLHLWFCAFKTATLASESLVSIGPSPHLWFLHAKQRLFDPNDKSMGPRLRLLFFCIQNSDFSTRIASLYGSQPSSMVLCIHYSDIMTRIYCLYGSQTSPVVLCMQNSVMSIRKLVSMGPSPLWFLHAKQRD